VKPAQSWTLLLRDRSPSAVTASRALAADRGFRMRIPHLQQRVRQLPTDQSRAVSCRPPLGRHRPSHHPPHQGRLQEHPGCLLVRPRHEDSHWWSPAKSSPTDILLVGSRFQPVLASARRQDRLCGSCASRSCGGRTTIEDLLEPPLRWILETGRSCGCLSRSAR
jgi:hypothetical protein